MMKVWELMDVLKRVNDEAQVYVAEECNMHEPANKIFVADELNIDGELSFQDFGISLGDKAVLITIEND